MRAGQSNKNNANDGNVEKYIKTTVPVKANESLLPVKQYLGYEAVVKVYSIRTIKENANYKSTLNVSAVT